MIAHTRTYSSVVIEKPSTIQLQLFDLIRRGRSSKLNAYLHDRQYARSLLISMYTNPLNNECLSLLMVAVLHGHDMVVREILSHSPDKAKTVELEGRIHSVSGDLVDKVTALWCALDRAHFPIARTLIDLGGANINHGPLHSLLIDASSRGRLDIVHFLIENGYADVNQTTINDENTALAVAAMEGHLELVKLLCIVGVSSSSRNHAKKTPIMLAAENNKLDVVNFLLEHNHNNATFNDLELSVALHILSHKDTENFRSEWVMKILRHSLTKRTELKIPKVTAEPIIVYNFQQESQSIDDLDQIQDHDDGLYTEALLIQERTLLPQKDERLLTSLFERATIFVEKGQFDQCIDLMVHILHLSQQFEHPIDFKQFFWLFYNMFNSKLPIPINRFWEACDIIFKPSQKNSNDYQMRDQSYLLAAIAKV